MTAFLVYGLTGAALFCTGLFGVITARQPMRKVLAFNVAGGGVFLFLVAAAQRVAEPFPDPVPHAMVLTGIVVAVSATALALALICRIQEISTSPPAGKDERSEHTD